MGTSFRTTTLASAIGIALIGASFSVAVPAASSPAAKAAAQNPANTLEHYIIRFNEPGLLHYAGGTQGITATAPKALGQRKLDVHAPAAVAYQTFLQGQRDVHLAAIAQSIGRQLDVNYVYSITMNGVGVDLSAAEASKIATLPGVAAVRRAPDVPLATYHGPEYIGADHVWDGSDVPGGLGTRGQGVVVADIDTGINSAHPSFADDPTCGVFGPTNHKLLSAVDCLTVNGMGQCVGTNPEANDGNGHGVHTASTAVGNTLDDTAVPPPAIPAPYTFMSGVAPCASLRTYKVCATNNCSGQAIQAATETAIADQVDVITFSISGGTDPWNDSDRTFLDAVGADIFVAAAAGNTGAATTDPVGAVNHLGPWVASVAATTHDLNPANSGLLSATGPGSPPPNTQNISANPPTPFIPGGPFTDTPIRHYALNEIGCTAGGGFPADYFDGAIALISRGTCTFEEKIDNAQAAGAMAAIIYNNVAGGFGMLIGAASLPSYSILMTDGQNLETFIDANDPTPTTVDLTPSVVQGDVLAGFSLRGPTPPPFDGITKPDIGAPGVNIYAALDTASGSYGYLSGTSMATPHTAGSGTLLRAVHPDWTPQEVKSALMLTAFTGGHEEDLTTPWTPDDVGSGRVDLTKAALAGFVMDETFDNFLAADPGTGGDPSTLNIPSARNVSCATSCTWTRTIRNALGGAANWSVTVNNPTGLNVTVDPSSFAFTGGDRIFGDGFDGAPPPPLPEFQPLTITATPTQALADVTFAEIVFHETNGLAPDAHIYVAVEGQP